MVITSNAEQFGTRNYSTIVQLFKWFLAYQKTRNLSRVFNFQSSISANPYSPPKKVHSGFIYYISASRDLSNSACFYTDETRLGPVHTCIRFSSCQSQNKSLQFDWLEKKCSISKYLLIGCSHGDARENFTWNGFRHS